MVYNSYNRVFYEGRGHRNSSGFTLVEILVTLVIVSIGLAGLAAMDVYSYRKNNDSYLRSQAVLQAHEMAARMHANPGELSKKPPVVNGYNSISGSGLITPTPNCLDRASTTKSAAGLAATNCSESDLAAFDADEWLYSTASILPNGAGTVTGPVDGVYTITISWNEAASDGEAATPKNFVFEFRPLP